MIKILLKQISNTVGWFNGLPRIVSLECFDLSITKSCLLVGYKQPQNLSHLSRIIFCHLQSGCEHVCFVLETKYRCLSSPFQHICKQYRTLTKDALAHCLSAALAL
jgi:hypothetical protein